MRPAEEVGNANGPTPEDQLVDRQGRPYFLWDVEMTLEEFRTGLRDPDPEVRAYLAGKLMRQARVGDVDRFLSTADARSLWPLLSRYLGRTREAWRVRLGVGEEPQRADR